MKALQILSGADVAIVELPIPQPGPGEVRVRIDAVTICTQWDLHLRHNSPMFPGHQFHYPYTVGQPGHEGSGVVDAVGANVTQLKEGDRVSLWRDPGHGVQGCFAHYVVRETSEVIRVPEHLSPVATAPVELAMCVACSIMQMASMDAIRGKRVAVAGLGPAGLIAIQMLRAEGAAHITGIDPVAKRREIAVQLGADVAYSPDEAAEAIPLRNAAILDSAIDCVGAERSLQFLMDRVADTISIFGVLRGEVKFGFQHYIGLRLCGYPPHNRPAAEYAVQLMAEGKLDLMPVISHVMPMAGYRAAIDMLERQEATKVCLLPWVD